MPVAEYEALGTEQKLALVQQTPPMMGESKEAWYARAKAAFGGGGGGAPFTVTGGPIPTTRPVPFRTGQYPTRPDVQETPAVGVSAIPAALAAVIPASLLAAVGGAYGLAQMVGVQFPWETGPGEGFISPMTRDIKQDESGRWVTQETRPDLWNGAMPGTMVPAGGQVTVSVPRARGVVKTWDTGYTMPDGTRVPGWPFAMTSDADGKHKRIHTVNKDGVPVSWTPYKSIVIGKTLTASNVRRVATRINSHVKSLKKVLSVLK